MRVFILFSTTHGHARRLAQFAAAHLINFDHDVQIHDAAQTAQFDLTEFDAALLIASVQIGRYRHSFVDFARKNHAALDAMANAFVSVSLAATGGNPSDRAGLQGCLERLKSQTLWHPATVYHAAGALPFSHYGFLLKLIMKFIARNHGAIVNTSRDYDFTDYVAFEKFIDDFVASANSPIQRPATAA